MDHAPQPGDVVVTRESAVAVECYTVRERQGAAQFSAYERDLALRLARGFARSRLVDVWYCENETDRLLEAYRPRTNDDSPRPPMSLRRSDRSGDLDATSDKDIKLAARLHVPVLVTSESPEQRDLHARLVHATSHWARGPFVTYFANGVVAPHSPTCCDEEHDVMLRHQFNQAHGGTLFVDDIATLTTRVQAELLALLEEAVLADRSRSRGDGASARLISGASRHLDRERVNGTFSERLFYRLNTVHIDLIRQSGS